MFLKRNRTWQQFKTEFVFRALNIWLKINKKWKIWIEIEPKWPQSKQMTHVSIAIFNKYRLICNEAENTQQINGREIRETETKFQ